tara:strand:+ start:315 stop:788 length:474 start_codon:yes stop_codon:yes gene_type:complete
MSFIETIANLNLDPSTPVTLTMSEGTDVFVHNESEVETALSETDVVNSFAELISTPGLNASTQYGGDVLESLREEGLLDDYERGNFSFAEFIAEAITENFYDVDLIDYSTEKYDHKRGFCTLTATVNVTVDNLLSTRPFLMGWEVSVPTDNGTLTLN